MHFLIHLGARASGERTVKPRGEELGVGLTCQQSAAFRQREHPAKPNDSLPLGGKGLLGEELYRGRLSAVGIFEKMDEGGLRRRLGPGGSAGSTCRRQRVH